MDLSEYVTIEQAAEIMKYKRDSVSLLCRQGKLDGAQRIGHRWLIPRKTAENFKKAPQGFAVIWARRKAEKLAKENKATEVQNESVQKNVDEEILECLKMLIDEVRELKGLIAQAKR